MTPYEVADAVGRTGPDGLMFATRHRPPSGSPVSGTPGTGPGVCSNNVFTTL